VTPVPPPAPCDNRAMRTMVGVLACLSLGAAAVPPASARQAVPAGQAATPDPVDLARQARRLNLEGRLAESLALYNQALAREPGLFEAHLGIGIVLDLEGRYADARRHFAKAIEVAPEEAKPQALTAMGVSFAFGHDAPGAARFYQQVFDRHMAAADYAGAAEDANALGRVFLEAGDTDDAYRWYETGFETARRQKGASSADADLRDLRWAHAQARIAARRGDAAEARRQTAVVKALVDKGSNPDQAIQYPYLSGYVDFYLKDYAGAIAALQQADARDPFIQVLLARALEKSGQAASAREHYRKVLESNAHSPNNAFARPLARKKLGAR